jgi:hypothetical protein
MLPTKKTKYIVPCETALSGLIHAAETFVRKFRSSATKNYGMACPRMRKEERTPMTADILNNQSRTSERGWSSNLSVGRRVLTTVKTYHVTRHLTKSRTYGHLQILYIHIRVYTEC